MIEALDHNAVFSRGEGYLKLLFSHHAILLSAFIVAGHRCAAQMCEYSPPSKGSDGMRKEKINRIRFGQILTNQASPFKSKNHKERLVNDGETTGQKHLENASILLSSCPIF